MAEVTEPFRQGQIGSSAVPVKRNPIKSERVSSIARILRSLVGVSMENISLWHERDLSNSANERFTIPMSAILVDEMLNLTTKVISEPTDKQGQNHLKHRHHKGSDLLGICS